jgi:hypothetical protein
MFSDLTFRVWLQGEHTVIHLADIYPKLSDDDDAQRQKDPNEDFETKQHSEYSPQDAEGHFTLHTEVAWKEPTWR